jgi:hypothetical protein
MTGPIASRQAANRPERGVSGAGSAARLHPRHHDRRAYAACVDRVGNEIRGYCRGSPASPCEALQPAEPLGVRRSEARGAIGARACGQGPCGAASREPRRGSHDGLRRSASPPGAGQAAALGRAAPLAPSSCPSRSGIPPANPALPCNAYCVCTLCSPLARWCRPCGHGSWLQLHHSLPIDVGST